MNYRTNSVEFKENKKFSDGKKEKKQSYQRKPKHNNNWHSYLTEYED